MASIISGNESNICSIDEMKQIASRIVSLISTRPFKYEPKKRPVFESVTGWGERFLGYRWRDKNLAFYWSLIEDLENTLSMACDDLIEQGDWTIDQEREVIQKVRELFEWGGVLRGKGHNPPDPKAIRAVMLTAASYSNDFKAPHDSAWTKLAALSTVRNSVKKQNPPHVIYDSRVSVSLLESIDFVTDGHAELSSARRSLMRAGLGYVRGRGGFRHDRTQKLHKKGWLHAYGKRKWESQFIASRLVNYIVNELQNNEVYGLMPAPTRAKDWTTRGVEMVLFMDGY